MPVILIIVGLAVLLGVGSFMLRPEDTPTPIITDIVDTTSTTKEETTIPKDTTTTTNTETAATSPTPVGTAPTTNTPVAAVPPVVATTVYANGAHTVTTTYKAPGDASHNVNVNLTLKDDIVTAATVSYSGDKVDTSSNYQSKFSAAYQAQVIGRSLNSIKLSRVGGASLTTGAFNAALAEIKTKAKN
jgi:hypothetical protein